MSEPTIRTAALLPALAIFLAIAYLVAACWLPGALPVATGAAAVAACMVVLTRRRSGILVLTLALVAFWLTLGLAGAWLLRGQLATGLCWVLVGLFAVPLPVIPWLYWKSALPIYGARSPEPGARPPVHSERSEP